MDDEELRDPEYWKRMRDDFQKVDPDHHLVLNWSYFPSTGNYFFLLHFDHKNQEHQAIEAAFSALAARAGRITKKYANPTQGWFHLIATSKGLNVEKVDMKDRQTGLVRACLNGFTDRLSEISATLCSRYEKQMVEEISIRNYARKLGPIKVADSVVKFPNRASWICARLKERGWDKNSLYPNGGPDRKTVQKIMEGRYVRVEVLPRVVDALNHQKIDNVKINLTDIPSD